MRRLLPRLVLAFALVGASARAEEPPPIDSPFLGAGGEVRTIVRPEFRDAAGLLDDLNHFGIEGLRVELIGPLVANPEKGKPPLPSRLLLIGDAEVLARTREVLLYLDVPRAAVRISLLAVEVECLTEAQHGGHFLFSRTTEAGSPDTIYRGAAALFEPEAFLRSSISGAIPFQGTSVRFAGAMSDVVQNGAYEYVFRMLAADRQANFLAWPTVLCTEGEEGLVESIVKKPRLLQVTGGPNPATLLATPETRIALSAVPVRIARDAAEIQLAAEISYQQDERLEDAPAASSRLRMRKVVTRVTVRDRSAVVVGGLRLRRRLFSGYGTPFLRDIPGVNVLTSAGSKRCVESELVLVVRVRVLTAGPGAGLVLPPGEARRHRRASRD